jgi:hypothetical protein
MRISASPTILEFALILCCAAPLRADDLVNESAREIPVAADVDVVVVGGGTGAVAAAVAAAEAGQDVFLAAPFPYLGEDMTGTLQLWLNEGETPESPLAKRVFSDRTESEPDPDRLAFSYEADVPSNAIHRDFTPPGRLTDGRWSNASSESVQYDTNVRITCDLGTVQPVRQVRLMGFRRPLGSSSGSGFDVKRMTVEVSGDGQAWDEVATIENSAPEKDFFALAAEIDADIRYARVFVEKPEGFERLLLGELEIVGPPREKTAEPKLAALPPRPMHVKRTLDQVLLEAGVQFLYCSFATDVLRDTRDQPCGIVIANRAGRQAVIAKTMIDATPRAVVARMAGARFRAFQGGTHTFRRVVIGGKPQSADYVSARIAAPPFRAKFRTSAEDDGYQVIEYTLPLHLEDDSYPAYMRVDQQARTLTYDPDQQFTSDVLFEVPTDPMIGREASAGDWDGISSLPIGAFQPADVDRLYVLSGMADVSREQAAELLRPLALIDAGTRLGQVAADEASDLERPGGVNLPGTPTATPVADGDVREPLQGARPTEATEKIAQSDRGLPVLREVDVLVIGGGTGGAPAGIGAARQGAETLVIEYLHGLGGVGTQGAIASYYWGNRVGFTAEVQQGQTKWIVEQKMEWYRQELLQAGAEIWFGCIGCGAFVQGDRVRGAVVATPYGRGVVLANTVIDATGNSDIAASAGAETIYTDATEFGMQGTGLPGRRLGGSYNNTDFTIVDETDMVDVWHVLVYSKAKYEQAFDHGRLIDTRERRRIVGDFTITLADQLNERTYPDSVVQSWSNFDTHGYTVDPMLLLEHPEKVGINVYTPLRAMLPKGLEGLIVTGLSISAHRDAVPLIRMQADIQNGGYAAGVAAAMVAKAGTTIREVDIRALQRHLIEKGNLPESVLTDKDSYPLPHERIVEAVALLKDGRGSAVVMTHLEQALPLIRDAYRDATGEDRLAYARALAVLGDDLGLEPLLAAVREADGWDEGWNYRGMGQFGAALSPLDTLIISLGRAGNPKAVPVILDKVRQLDAYSAFSHHRAVGLALELLADPAAAPVLAELLAKPGMSGQEHTSIDVAAEKGAPGGTNAEQTRRESLRELMLARALYRCGDHNGLGERILDNYTRDLRGHLARHAKAILETEW